ncbi:probable kinase CHARK [Phragmites australis]|uniref:probable kinase CHARK n=1 Tax=Phragmites australis TaxID=29695 RepID=UPI002D76509B|nr:probable kinase CHARK [Phragmites australis]
MANFSEFVYHIAGEPYDYLGSGSSAAGYLRSSSPIDSFRGYPGVVNATGSSSVVTDTAATVERIRHRNILQLLGWCDGSGGLLLVDEFMSNGSLDKHLYDPQKLLTWSHRYKIALGVGYAILYLHTECDQCVVHGDIKPANILLDPSFNAKLGDFGLARLVDHGADSRTTQVVAGTAGYIDPEFVNSCRPSTESDVYSFGVVLLEIASGRRPTSTQSTGTPIVLLNWVRYMYRQNSILGAADRRLEREFDERQMRRVLTTGLWCTHRDRIKRPSIAQAMDVLRRDDAELPVLDPEMLSSSVRSLEENSNGHLSAEDSSYENWSAETAYHTSKDSTYLLAQE